MSKYTSTPIGWFLDQPILDFYDWLSVINSEIKRENDAMKER